MQNAQLVAQMTENTFAEVVQTAPRRIRETLFGRLGIKAKKPIIGLRLHAKNEDRTKKLHERLKSASTKQEDDLCQELLRNWLYTKRPMLKAALDHLGIKNDNGLIEEEPTFFAELDATKAAELQAKLSKEYPAEDVTVYLKFMGVQHLTA